MGVPQQAQNGLIGAYKDVPPTSGCWPGGGFYERIGSALAAVNARAQSTVKWDNP